MERGRGRGRGQKMRREEREEREKKKGGGRRGEEKAALILNTILDHGHNLKQWGNELSFLSRVAFSVSLKLSHMGIWSYWTVCIFFNNLPFNCEFRLPMEKLCYDQGIFIFRHWTPLSSSLCHAPSGSCSLISFQLRGVKNSLWFVSSLHSCVNPSYLPLQHKTNFLFLFLEPYQVW